MQLVLGVKGSWKSVDVQLVDGCLPSVGGQVLPDSNFEPARWFKVLVLECMCVDCAERVVSWTVKDKLVNRMSRTQPPHTPTSSPLTRSLMAPHEGDSVTVGGDELAIVFELAEVLFQAGAQSNPRSRLVEQRTWMRLVHSYLLPLVNFSSEDLSCLQEAQSQHAATIAYVEEIMSEASTQSMEVKDSLSELRSSLLPHVAEWAESGQCSHMFLELLVSDIQDIEEKARSKILSSKLALDLDDRLTTPLAGELRSRFTSECSESEQLLLEMLTLRSRLHQCLVTIREESSEDMSVVENGDEEPWPTQKRYVCQHQELSRLKEKAIIYSKRKVLALSVREALDQSVTSLESLGSADGPDRGARGGHSTDVLLPSASKEYQTLRDKLVMVLRTPACEVAFTHANFCTAIQGKLSELSEDFVVVRKSQTLPILNQHSHKLLSQPAHRANKDVSLVDFVRGHFDEMMGVISRHFHNNDTDFLHRMWLCYEKIFFEKFSKDLMTHYLSSQRMVCQSLQMNSLSASLQTPESLRLDVPLTNVAELFPPRTFELVTQLHREVKGVIFDLESLSRVSSPLEKLQLLTSAFRKCMASLSRLKMSQLAGSSDQPSPSAVNCDDLMPVLVMVLLGTHPLLLASIHVNTKFLDDFIAPFLSSGWYGYSLASFLSAIQVISEL